MMTIEISDMVGYMTGRSHLDEDSTLNFYGSRGVAITPSSSDTEISNLLIEICRRGFFEFFQKIVEKLEGVKPRFNYAGVTAPQDETLYHAAAAGGSLELVQYLESKLGLNYQVFTEIGSSPLDYAAQAGKVKICKWIIQNKEIDMAWVDASSVNNAVQSLYWAMYDRTYPSETFDYLKEKFNEHLDEKQRLLPNEYENVREECIDVLAKFQDHKMLLQALLLPHANLEFIKWIENNFNSKQKRNMIEKALSNNQDSHLPCRLYERFQTACYAIYEEPYYNNHNIDDFMETLWTMISNIGDEDRSKQIKRSMLTHDNYKGIGLLCKKKRHRMVMRFLEWAEDLEIKNEMLLAADITRACWCGWVDVVNKILESQTHEKKTKLLKDGKFDLFWKACRGTRNTSMIEAILTLAKELGVQKEMLVAEKCKGFIAVCMHGTVEAANLLLSFCEREDKELALDEGKKRGRKSLKSSLIDALCTHGFAKACQFNDITMIQELYLWGKREGVNKKMLKSRGSTIYEYGCLYYVVSENNNQKKKKHLTIEESIHEEHFHGWMPGGESPIKMDNEKVSLLLQWIAQEGMTYEMMMASESRVFERICQSRNASIVDDLLNNITGEQINEIISARQYAPFISACLSGCKEVVNRLLNSWKEGSVNRNKMSAADNYKGILGAYQQCIVGNRDYTSWEYSFYYSKEWQEGSNHFYIIKTLWRELSHEQKKQFIVMFDCENLQYGVVLGLMKLIQSENNMLLLDDFIIKTIDPLIQQLFSKKRGNLSATKLLLSLFEFSKNYKNGKNIMAFSMINKKKNFKAISCNIESEHLKEYYKFCIKTQPAKLKNLCYTQNLIDIAKDRMALPNKQFHEIMMLFPIEILTSDKINIFKGVKNMTMEGNKYSWSYHFMNNYIKVLAEKFNQMYTNENLENISDIEESLSFIMSRFQFAFEKHKKPFMAVLKDMDNWWQSAAYLKANFIFNLFANKVINISQKNYELFKTLCQHPLAEFIPNFNTIDETKNYDQLSTACRKMIECAFKFKRLFGNENPLLLLQSVIPPLFFCNAVSDTDCCNESQNFCDKHDLTVMDGNELQNLIKEKEALKKTEKEDGTSKDKKNTGDKESNFVRKCKAFLKATDPIQNHKSKKRKRNKHPNKNAKKKKKRSQTLPEPGIQPGSVSFFLPATGSLTGANSPSQAKAGSAAPARPVARFQREGIVTASGSEPGTSSNFKSSAAGSS